MGQELDTNEENNVDRNFEKHRHDKPENVKKDADGRDVPHTGDPERDRDIENDGGAVGRNNGADKSGR